MYVETFLHPDGRVFTLSTEDPGNGFLLHTNYISVMGEVTSDVEACITMTEASAYRRGILNMLKWSGFVGTHAVVVS